MKSICVLGGLTNAGLPLTEILLDSSYHVIGATLQGDYELSEEEEANEFTIGRHAGFARMDAASPSGITGTYVVCNNPRKDIDPGCIRELTKSNSNEFLVFLTPVKAGALYNRLSIYNRIKKITPGTPWAPQRNFAVPIMDHKKAAASLYAPLFVFSRKAISGIF